MQPVTCIAVDDEPWALALIKGYIEKIPGLILVQSFEDAIAAGEFVRKYPVDILFADINMPDISGIDLVASLTVKPAIIFTTAYKKFAYEGFQLEAVDYLLKPFTLKRFEKAVDKANDLYNLLHNATANEQSKYLLLKADYGIVKVMLADILFTEGLDNYLKINLHNKNTIVVRLTMKALMEKLNENEFLRVHRSFIVSVMYVEFIKHKIITLAGGEEIPIGKSYEGIVKGRWDING